MNTNLIYSDINQGWSRYAPTQKNSRYMSISTILIYEQIIKLFVLILQPTKEMGAFMQYVCFHTSSHELAFHDACQILINAFSKVFRKYSRTMKMVTTNFKYSNNEMSFLSDFLKLSPSSLKELERERLTLRFHQPLIVKFKEAAKARNMSVNLYLEQAMVEKLKTDELSAQLKEEVETYSLLKNKDITELVYLKQLLNKTLQDNHKLKKAVDKYRSTNNGSEFESFELF